MGTVEECPRAVVTGRIVQQITGFGFAKGRLSQSTSPSRNFLITGATCEARETRNRCPSSMTWSLALRMRAVRILALVRGMMGPSLPCMTRVDWRSEPVEAGPASPGEQLIVKPRPGCYPAVDGRVPVVRCTDDDSSPEADPARSMSGDAARPLPASRGFLKLSFASATGATE